jgi:type IV secretory pathway TraG/TraD family ATPase VirD4
MITLLNKSRSAGYMLNLYTQTWSDVEAKLGNAAKAGQVAGNLNTTIMMRVKEIATAEMLTNQLPETNVNALMAVSGADDGALGGGAGISFKSKNEDRISTIRVPLITPSDIVGLPVGHAYAMLSGSHPHKIRIPLLKNANNTDLELPEFITEMVAGMRVRYRSTEGWYEYSDSVDVSQFTK